MDGYHEDFDGLILLSPCLQHINVSQQTATIQKSKSVGENLIGSDAPGPTGVIRACDVESHKRIATR